MRFAMLLGATAALWVQPASAATIVQIAANAHPAWLPGSFNGFNYSLGTLNSVSLEISGTERRLLGAVYPAGATGPITIDWTIDGDANFSLYRLFPQTEIAKLAVPISGSGQVVVTETGAWNMTTFGSGAFAIDPLLIPADDDDIFNRELRVRFVFDNYNSSDTQITTSEPIHFYTAPNGCLGPDGSPSGGDETCNEYVYRLTYDYTPDGGVPEPSTWAMMLVGFGAIGATLRRRRGRKIAAPSLRRGLSPATLDG